MELGGPQGLLLAQVSARAVVAYKAAQQAHMVERLLIAVAITIHLVKDLRIFLCRFICSAYLACKLRRFKHGSCFPPFHRKRFSCLSALYEWQIPGHGQCSYDKHDGSRDPETYSEIVFWGSTAFFSLFLFAHSEPPSLNLMVSR